MRIAILLLIAAAVVASQLVIPGVSAAAAFARTYPRSTNFSVHRRLQQQISAKCSACNLWPFRMSTSDGGDGGGGGGQHLIQAGQHLQAAAESVGPQNLACPHLLQDAGDALAEVGQYWEESWEAVTYAAEEASSAFYSLARLQKRTELASFYSGSSNELKAISGIVGCTSVGPPSAVPNLEALAKFLREAGQFVEKEGECRDSRAFGKALRQASKSVLALAKEY